MAVQLSAAAKRNYPECRRVYDSWYDFEKPGYPREAGWVRLVAALDTESKCEILAHGGGWDGGNRTNSAQRTELRKSSQRYREATGKEPDGVGNNGGSVGPLQQIPTSVARLRTEDGMDGGRPTPWEGWGDMVDCMVFETCLPKFLRQLRVGTSKSYKGKPMADLIDGAEIVVDLLNVQQPAADEVETNYGASIVRRAKEIAGMYPQTAHTEKEWSDMASEEEYKRATSQAFQESQILKDTSENAYEARRITGVLSGVTSLAGNGERSVEQQVFGHKLGEIKGDYNLHQFLVELNRKVDLLVERSTQKES